MGFKVTNRSNDAGGFTFSYGKGSNKLTENVVRAGQKFVATIGGVAITGTLKDLKERWGVWASLHYAGNNGVEKTAPPKHEPAIDPTDYTSSDKLPGDELSQYARDFFKILSEKRGELNEWQRGQARLILKTIGWPNRKPQDIVTGDEPTKAPAKPKGPPAHKPKKETSNDEPSGSTEAADVSGTPDNGDGGESAEAEAVDHGEEQGSAFAEGSEEQTQPAHDSSAAYG